MPGKRVHRALSFSKRVPQKKHVGGVEAGWGGGRLGGGGEVNRNTEPSLADMRFCGPCYQTSK